MNYRTDLKKSRLHAIRFPDDPGNFVYSATTADPDIPIEAAQPTFLAICDAIGRDNFLYLDTVGGDWMTRRD